MWMSLDFFVCFFKIVTITIVLYIELVLLTLKNEINIYVTWV